MSDDAAVVASTADKAVFENDQIRVLDLRMDPGDKTARLGFLIELKG